MDAAHGEIHARQNTSSARRGSVPRPSTRHGIGVEAAAALLDDFPHGADIIRIMDQLEFFDGSVPAFQMLDTVEELGILTKRARDGAETTDVLGMSPSRVVAATIAVRDERGPHGP